MKDKLDVKYTLEDSNGNKYTILDTQRVDLQEELNKIITKQMKEIERLKEEMKRIKDVYTSMLFSAPENMYIFIEQLGNILDKVSNNEDKNN